MTQRTLKSGGGATWYPTKVRKGPDQRKVCAARHDELAYLCTREPGHGPKRKPLHVAHTGAEELTALVEWVEEGSK